MHHEKHFFKHLQVIGRFTLPLSLSFSRGIENPMSKCVPLCRPTWVQGVTPVTGALFSCRSITNGFCCFLHTLDYLNRLRFTTVFPKSKPPGTTVFTTAGYTESQIRRAYGE